MLPYIDIRPGTVAVKETLRGRFPIEREAVLTRPGERPRQWRWKKINLLALNPRDYHLYTTAIYFAKRFVGDMHRQGFELLTPEADMTIAGPLPHLAADTSGRGVGRHKGQEQTEQYVDFVIAGDFIRRRPVVFEYDEKHQEGNFAHAT